MTDSIRVERGNPTDLEVAALVSALAAFARRREAHAPEVDSRLAGGWSSYHRTLRAPISPGRGAWRNTFR